MIHRELLHTHSASELVLQVGIKGQEPIIKGDLAYNVKAENCYWSLDNSAIEATLQKADGMSWWKSVIKGDPEINTQQVRGSCKCTLFAVVS